MQRVVEKQKVLPSQSPFGDGNAARKIEKIVREGFLE
jgi:hypothetical protein